MERALGALRAFGILFGVWFTLAFIAFVAGVIPSPAEPPSEEPLRPEEPETRPEKAPAKSARPDPAPAKRPPPERPTTPEPDPEPIVAPTPPPVPSTTPAVERHVVCAADVAEASLDVIEVIGDAQPELAVGCGGQVHLLALEAREEAVVPVRFALITLDNAIEGTSLRAAVAAAGDVTGDNLPDLVLGFWRSTPEGGARGGDLYLVPRTAGGHFASPAQLAPIAAVDVALGALDTSAGLDLAAVSLGDAVASRASDLWLFTGGATPRRAATRPSGRAGQSVGLADLDKDGSLDMVVAATDDSRVDLFFGDGRGQVARSTRLAVPGAATIATGDVDSDHAIDVVVAGAGLHLILARAGEEIAARTVEGVPHGLRIVGIADVDEDGRTDLLAMHGDRPILLRQSGNLTFEDRALVTLEGAPLVASRFAVASLGGGPGLDLVLLARTADDAPWELVIANDAVPAGRIVVAAQGRPVADAPLRLDLALR